MFWLMLYMVIGFFIAYLYSKKAYTLSDTIVVWALWPACLIFWGIVRIVK